MKNLINFWKLFFVMMLAIVFMPYQSKAQHAVERSFSYGMVPFNYGEKLTYKIKYSLYVNMSVGEVTFEVADKPKEIAGENHMHLISLGRTYGFYDAFFKVRDRYESYINEKNLLPTIFIRLINEGSYKNDEQVTFNQKNKTAKSKKRTQKIPDGTQDVLSALYFARTFNYANANVGDSFMLHAFLDDTTYEVGVKYMGIETVKTKKGNFKCYKLQPLLIVDRVFKSENDMTLWVTADNNKLPVRIESGISVGSIVAELAGYSGLKHDLTAKLK